MKGLRKEGNKGKGMSEREIMKGGRRGDKGRKGRENRKGMRREVKGLGIEGKVGR